MIITRDKVAYYSRITTDSAFICKAQYKELKTFSDRHGHVTNSKFSQ
jgi:hypothetical protein